MVLCNTIQVFKMLIMSINGSFDILQSLGLWTNGLIQIFKILIIDLILLFEVFNNLSMRIDCSVKFVKSGVYTGLTLLECLGGVDEVGA